MLLNIEHRTHYAYSESVNYTIQQLRLTPPDGFGQRVKRWEIRVNGHLYRQQDTYGNTTHMLVVDTPHNEISIIASGEIETGLDLPAVENALPKEIYLRETPLTNTDAALREFALGFAGANAVEHPDLDAMMHAVLERVSYIKGSTAVDTTAMGAFKLGSGVCQDHAHIFIACCRSLGLPARYVSGYLFTQDGSLMESHAWADVWLDESWASFDVSNGCYAGDTHVRLACGLDYRDACPVSGIRMGGGTETMVVGVEVNQANNAQASLSGQKWQQSTQQQ